MDASFDNDDIVYQGRYITLCRAKVINSILIDKRASNLLLPSAHTHGHHDTASGSFIRPIINVGCGVIGLIHDQCRGSFSFGISVGTALDSQDQDRQWAEEEAAAAAAYNE